MSDYKCDGNEEVLAQPREGQAVIRFFNILGFRFGIGPMLSPGTDLPVFSIDRWFFFMHRCATDIDGRYIEFWQLRFTWFYIGRAWTITSERFVQWAEADT